MPPKRKSTKKPASPKKTPRVVTQDEQNEIITKLEQMAKAQKETLEQTATAIEAMKSHRTEGRDNAAKSVDIAKTTAILSGVVMTGHLLHKMTTELAPFAGFVGGSVVTGAAAYGLHKFRQPAVPAAPSAPQRDTVEVLRHTLKSKGLDVQKGTAAYFNNEIGISTAIAIINGRQPKNRDERNFLIDVGRGKPNTNATFHKDDLDDGEDADG